MIQLINVGSVNLILDLWLVATSNFSHVVTYVNCLWACWQAQGGVNLQNESSVEHVALPDLLLNKLFRHNYLMHLVWIHLLLCKLTLSTGINVCKWVVCSFHPLTLFVLYCWRIWNTRVSFPVSASAALSRDPQHVLLTIKKKMARLKQSHDITTGKTEENPSKPGEIIPHETNIKCQTSCFMWSINMHWRRSSIYGTDSDLLMSIVHLFSVVEFCVEPADHSTCLFCSPEHVSLNKLWRDLVSRHRLEQCEPHSQTTGDGRGAGAQGATVREICQIPKKQANTIQLSSLIKRLRMRWWKEKNVFNVICSAVSSRWLLTKRTSRKEKQEAVRVIVDHLDSYLT